jgi:hypothetical protein
MLAPILQADEILVAVQPRRVKAKVETAKHSKESHVMAKYGKKANESVERAMHKRKRGTLRSGGSGKTVKSRKQAIAIGLSEAREKGAKVPAKKSAKRRTSKKKSRKSS